MSIDEELGLESEQKFENIGEVIDYVRQIDDVYEENPSLRLVRNLKERYNALENILEQNEELRRQFNSRNSDIFKQLRVAARLDVKDGKKGVETLKSEILASRKLVNSDKILREINAKLTREFFEKLNLLDASKKGIVSPGIWMHELPIKSIEDLKDDRVQSIENFVLIVGSLVSSMEEFAILHNEFISKPIKEDNGWLMIYEPVLGLSEKIHRWSRVKGAFLKIAEIADIDPNEKKDYIKEMTEKISMIMQSIFGKKLQNYTDDELVEEYRRRGLYTAHRLQDEEDYEVLPVQRNREREEG
jgi:hypothetical protein